MTQQSSLVSQMVVFERYGARLNIDEMAELLAPVMTDVVGINARLHFRRGWRAAEFAHGIGRARSET